MYGHLPNKNKWYGDQVQYVGSGDWLMCKYATLILSPTHPRLSFTIFFFFLKGHHFTMKLDANRYNARV